MMQPANMLGQGGEVKTKQPHCTTRVVHLLQSPQRAAKVAQVFLLLLPLLRRLLVAAE
jgi:hypothetical protein